MLKLHGFKLFLLVATLLVGAQARSQDVRVDTLQALRSTTPIPGSQSTPGDFNGDGISDLLLYNPLTSQMSYWLLGANSDGAIVSVGSRTFDLAKGYFAGAVGDFNGTGHADIVFTSAKRDLVLWSNDGLGGFRASPIDSYPAGWQLVGAGDIDGDGHDDLLWLNPSSCQFGYWLMKGDKRVGSKIVPVTCSYYPVSIGYYTPSNRISIVWSSALKDLYVWDSTPTGFVSSSLGSIYTSYHLLAVGGGFEGQMLTVMAGAEDNLRVGSGSGSAQQQMINRSFDVAGLQTAYANVGGFSGGFYFPWSSANFFIAGHGAAQTGAVYQFGNSLLMVCSAAGRADVNYAPAAMARTLVQPDACSKLNLPRGWFVVGAMANGVIPEVAP